MTVWNTVELRNLCSRLSSGKNIAAKDISGIGPYPVYGGNGIRGYTDTYNFDGECAIIGRQGAKCGNVRYFKGRAYMTEHAVVTCANDENNTRFLAYLLGTMQLGRLSGQSAQPGLSVKTLGIQEVNVPDLLTQRQISCLLGEFDDLIEHNKVVNKNLEGQAQALYDNLFTNVSFDATLADLGTVVGGSTPSKKHPEYYTDQGIAWITPKDLSNDSSKFIYHGENDITELGLSKCSATVMPTGTVLFSSRAPIGYIAVAANPVATNQGFKSVIPNKDIGTAFIYYFLKNNLTLIESMASGSTFKEISASVMKNVSAFIPIQDKLNIFRDFCNPLFTYQQKLEMENNRLSNLRNTLLPRLMSGDIDVSNIEV